MKTLEERKAESAALSARISDLSRVSCDTAYREGFRSQALARAIRAEEDNKIFLNGEGVPGVLVVGLGALPEKKRDAFFAALENAKASGNGALLCLDGCLGEIRPNAKHTAWVIDLESPRRRIMFGWYAGPGEQRYCGPRLPVTNGGAHWVGLAFVEVGHEAGKEKTVAFIQSAMECLAKHGRTPMAHQAWERAEREARNTMRDFAVKAMNRCGVPSYNNRYVGGWSPACDRWTDRAVALGKSDDLVDRLTAEIMAEQTAADEARIMAELEAEQTRLAAEKAEAEKAAAAEAKRQSDIAATCRATGCTAEQWEAMTPKQQGLAMHRARLNGKLKQ